MIDPGSIARQGYLETVLAIAVDGYLGSRDDGEEQLFPKTFLDSFGNTFTETYVQTFST
jgi:hypothetical protein